MKAEQLALLRELVELRPVSADPTAVDKVQERIRRFLEGHGVFCCMEQVEDRHILFASTTGNKMPDILFNPHVDVVPAIDPETQYHLDVRENGRIYGRGTADDLGNAVCVAQALTELLGRADAGAVFTGNEELGGSTSDAMIKRGYGAKKMILVVDGCRGPECVIHAHKGILILNLIARGTAGHSARPWLADNAVQKLLHGFGRLSERWGENPLSEDDWRNSMAPCIISGGHAENQIPDAASMVVNFRITGAEDLMSIPRMVADLTGLEVSVRRSSLPFVCDPDSPPLRLLAGVLRDLFGKEPSFQRMAGATDAHHWQKLGVPTAIMGCSGAGAHSASEYLEGDAIDRMLPVLVHFAVALQHA